MAENSIALSKGSVSASLHILTLLLTLWASSVSAQSGVRPTERLSELAGDGSVLLHSPSGEALVSINPDRALVPASIIKIPLTQVALTALGEDFRFETHFYTNEDGDLLIRGLGDPFLVSEEIASISNTLATHGLTQVRRLVMDDFAFESSPDLPVERGTDQPYGARNSALAVNFNTVNLAWSSAGNLISGEPQTPLTEFARELAGDFSPGEAQRINLGENPFAGLRQAQQLFQFFLQENGITVSDNNFYRNGVNDQWTLFYRHRSSRSLQDNLDGMLRYSNNFIANQLFLTLGAQRSGYPATTEAARNLLQQQLVQLYGDNYGRDENSLLMLEGSGLSRTQRARASGMIHILEVFKPHAQLLPEVGGVLRKSGTLAGVYNFIGYLQGPAGLYPFVILTNQSVNNRAEILRLLQTML